MNFSRENLCLNGESNAEPLSLYTTSQTITPPLFKNRNSLFHWKNME